MRQKLNMQKGQKMITRSSFGFSVLTVLFLTMAKEPYAAIVVVMFLVMKGILFMKQTKAVI